MAQVNDRSRFEKYVAATVIAIVVLVGIDRYTIMTGDVEVLRLKIISHHFSTAAANFRSEFLISKISKKYPDSNNGLLISGKFIFATAQGWPASVTNSVTEQFRPNDDDCYQLWKLLLVNPALITRGQFGVEAEDYRAFSKGDACRYQLSSQNVFFEYSPQTGQVLFSGISE